MSTSHTRCLLMTVCTGTSSPATTDLSVLSADPVGILAGFDPEEVLGAMYRMGRRSGRIGPGCRLAVSLAVAGTCFSNQIIGDETRAK